MRTSQDLVHQLEVGAGRKIISVGLMCLLVIATLVIYNFRGFKNMAAPEAMDQAQLARNISEGKGYTTDFVRPFSMYLLKRRGEETGSTLRATEAEKTRIKDRHPDISNAPGYPVLLAALMKALPFHFHPAEKPAHFWAVRYQPDYLIALFNQGVFFITIALTFFLTRRLFDLQIAVLSSILMFCSDLLWRFSMSGLSTTFLILLFVGLAWSLVLLEEQGREETRSMPKLLVLSAVCGLILGMGGLTRYSFAGLIIPALLYLAFFGGPNRWVITPVVLGVFLAVFTPWVVRNYLLSGTPFGTAGYAVFETSNGIERSLNVDLQKVPIGAYTRKLMTNTRQIMMLDLPRLGGTWLSAFFLVGLFIRYPMPAVARLRYFLLLCFPVLIFAQAFGKSHLSAPNTDLHSENFLVLLVPLVMVYGVSLFFLFLEQLDLPGRAVRSAAIVASAAIFSLPFILTLFLSGESALSEPYNPSQVRRVASFVPQNDLSMSDIPWAVAWYGNRQCVWMTLSPAADFLQIYDNQKEIRALYLTSVSLDANYLSLWVRFGGSAWGALFLQTRLAVQQNKGKWPLYFGYEIPIQKSSPTLFPLHYIQNSLNEHEPNVIDYILLTESPKPSQEP